MASMTQALQSEVSVYTQYNSYPSEQLMSTTRIES